LNGTARLSDQAIATDVLNSEKYAASVAGQSALESASPFVKRDFESIGRDCAQNVDVVFRLMSSKGWYQVSPVSQQSASQAQQEASSTLNGITGTVAPSMTMSVGQAGGGYQPGRFAPQAGASYSPGGGFGGYSTAGRGSSPGATGGGSRRRSTV